MVAKRRVELLYLAHRLGASVIIYYLSSVIYYLFLLTSYILHLHSTAITESVLGYLGAVLG